MSLHGKLVAVASRWLLKLFFLKLNDVLDVVRPRHWSWGTAVFWIPNKAVCILKQNENNLFHDQGCALRKISGSPLGSQAFYLSRPGLNVCRPNKNFGEPFGLPSIPAGVPRPLKLVARVHLMSKYFVRTRILLAITKLGNFSFWVRPKPAWSLMKPIKVFVPFRFKTRNGQCRRIV